ncbi:MAG: hypothetical protein RIF34_10665, partial [Candidatus Kapaibacterium sp.]
KKNYADKYTIQISLDDLFTDPLLITSSINTNLFNSDVLNYDTTYYWRTKVHLDSEEGEWSEIYRFRTKLEKPILSEPSLSSNEIPINGVLKWNSIAINTQSRIQISLTSDFSNPIKDEKVNTQIFNYSNLLNDKKYYWRVKSERGQYVSDWSNVFDFNTPSTIDRPQLNSPSNKERNLDVANLSLKWIALNNVTSYRIQVAVSDEFQNPLIDKSDVDINKFDFSQLEHNRVYYWRVKGLRSGGTESEWSETWMFSTIIPTPMLEQPINLSENVELESNLSWVSIDGANKYNVELATDVQFISKINESSRTITTN